MLVASARNAPRLPRQAAVLPGVLSARGTRPLSIASFVERNARRHASRPALVTAGEALTWRQFNRLANRFAHGLADRGIGRGDVVAMMLPNGPEVVALVAATAKLGAVAAPLNTAQRGKVLAHSVAVADSKAVVAAPEFAGRFDEPWPVADLPADRAWDPPSSRAVTLDDPAFTIFTSGTTGLPKASVMTHNRWVKAGAIYGAALLRLRPDDVLYVPLPFFHNMALTATWSSACRAGAALAIAPRFSASAFWDDCRRFGATAFPYIGEIPRYLLARPPSDADRHHSVRAVFGVGMRPDLWGPFCDRFGIDDVFESYAASEGNTMFVNPLAIRGSIGFCVTPHELVRYDVDAGAIVRGPDGKPVRAARGEPGLLLAEVTDRFAFDGYTDPEASEKKLHRDLFAPGDVWFDSGDLLRKIGWGHAEFVDRVGDTFRWKSENVSTGEVEAILGAHPGVAEVAVYGVEVPGAPGRAGMAAVVADPAAGLDLADLVAHCRRELPPYAVPVFVRLVGALETTGTHKHRKAGLRDEGYDPARVSDPLYVVTREDVRGVDGDAVAAIADGSLRL